MKMQMQKTSLGNRNPDAVKRTKSEMIDGPNY
jgi:hypothetical protein